MTYLLKPAFISLLLIPSLPAPANTLRDLLAKEDIPSFSFSSSDLQSKVWSSAFINDSGEKYLAYFLSPHKGRTKDIYIVKFDPTSGKLLRSTVHESEPCLGALWDLTKVDDYLLISPNSSPSAGCLLVINKKLAQTQILYGFLPKRVGQNQIVLIENMIHFAPVHPERLQFADLSRRTTRELYPPKDDPLRERLARENAEHMPSNRICMQMNDGCDPKIFDESIDNFTTIGQDRFALLVTQSASHRVPHGELAAKAGPQSVIYIYALEGTSGWKYCEKEISSAHAASIPSMQNWKFNQVEGVCTPNRPAIPEMSTAVMNPSRSRLR